MHIVKFANENFDNILEHRDWERKYFTPEVVEKILKRFENELSISLWSIHLGQGIDYGDGICLDEYKDSFKVYSISLMIKINAEEFDNIEDAIQYLITLCVEEALVDNPHKMKVILYQELGLSYKAKVKGPIKVLKKIK